MKIKFTLKIVFTIWALAGLTAVTAFAQTTAFNFQGRLNDGANPANGNVEMQFKLYDSLAGGTQIGATVLRPAVVVINGIFTTQLDFGAAAFDGSARFVEIGVRPAGNTNPFNVLNPRQPILSTPYAIQAKNAAQLGGLDASQYVTTTTVGNSFIKNSTVQQTGDFNITGSGFVGGNLGIGTTTPTSKLQVQAGGYGITQTSGGITVGSFITAAAGGSGWFGTQSNHPLNFFTNNSIAQMTLDTTGNFGIGTLPNAAYKLDVNGQANIRTGGLTGGGIVLGTPNGETGLTINGTGTNRADIRFDGSTLKLLVAPPGGPPPATNGIAITPAGSVGIGTTTPTAKLQVAGTIYADGNVSQTLASNGLVKAMLFVEADGTIIRCYNGITNSSSGNCGFSVTKTGSIYGINFGFQVSNRFASVTPGGSGTATAGADLTYIDAATTPNVLGIKTFVIGNSAGDAPFTIIVY